MPLPNFNLKHCDPILTHTPHIFPENFPPQSQTTPIQQPVMFVSHHTSSSTSTLMSSSPSFTNISLQELFAHV